MIDTLRVRLEGCEVLPEADLTVVLPEVSNKTGESEVERLLWRDARGREVLGKKAYHNGKFLNVDIDKYGVQVRASLPKLFTNTNNFYSLDRKQTEEAVEKLQGHLENEVGIKTNLLDAIPSRVDLFKNASLTYPTTYYFPILASIAEGKRLKKRDYGETVTFMNSQRELCFYDKIFELKQVHGYDVKGLPPYVMRGELRLLHGKPVKKGLGVRSVSELLECFDSFPSVFRNELERVVFHHKANVKGIGSEIERLKKIKQEAGRNAWQKILKSYGYFYFVERYTVEQFKAIVSEVGFSRFTVMREVRRFQEEKFNFCLFDKQEASSEELYTELYEKLVHEKLVA